LVTGAVTERLRGSVRNGRGRGTLPVTIVVTENATGAKRTCRSGKLRWTAVSSPGTIFAGTTSDGRPIVLQRSRDGRQVDALWVSFYAACQEVGGGFAIGEELIDFPLRPAASVTNGPMSRTRPSRRCTACAAGSAPRAPRARSGWWSRPRTRPER